MEGEEYEPISSPTHFEKNPDPKDEKSWTDWPEAWEHPPFEERLTQNLASNDFTNLPLDELSLATKHVAQAAQSSPGQMLKESLGFSIMGGNIKLVTELLIKILKANDDLSDMYPAHMAANYLNGAKLCCNIFAEVTYRCFRERGSYVNENGHTVLDSLMQVILKAHSNCSPADVDDTLKDEIRFVGEEIDICGRWEADSDCYRKLLASGSVRVPFSWKHKFCHTSAQAITHCIHSIARYGVLDTPSGLFLKHCSHCGHKLQLGPLHTLVFIAWLITRSGCEGEDLFGILACLLSLLSNGVSPLKPAHVSVGALLNLDEPSFCNHQEMRPSAFADKVAAIALDSGSEVARPGWRIICEVLRLAEKENDLQPPWHEYFEYNFRFTYDEKRQLYQKGHLNPSQDNILLGYREGCTVFCSRPFGQDRYLGHLWAAVKTELLNYRRLDAGDPWVSSYFSMERLLYNLENDTAITVGFFENQMIRPHCVCGNFADSLGLGRYVREKCSEYYFANLDDWHRTSFINLPVDLE